MQLNAPNMTSSPNANKKEDLNVASAKSEDTKKKHTNYTLGKLTSSSPGSEKLQESVGLGGSTGAAMSSVLRCFAFSSGILTPIFSERNSAIFLWP